MFYNIIAIFPLYCLYKIVTLIWSKIDHLPHRNEAHWEGSFFAGTRQSVTVLEDPCFVLMLRERIK